jgi:hypothetical protein
MFTLRRNWSVTPLGTKSLILSIEPQSGLVLYLIAPKPPPNVDVDDGPFRLSSGVVWLSLSSLVLVSVIGFRLRLQGSGIAPTKDWITTDKLIPL